MLVSGRDADVGSPVGPPRTNTWLTGATHRGTGLGGLEGLAGSRGRPGVDLQVLEASRGTAAPSCRRRCARRRTPSRAGWIGPSALTETWAPC